MVAAAGRRLLIDAMSAFGAIPCDAREIPFDALAASANKCIEGAPGLGLVICRKSALEACAGNAHSLALDLHEQWVGLEKTKQYRFTPPTHVIAAFDAALAQHAAEGGTAGRGARYRRNCQILVEGMRALGFRTLLPDALQAPIIVTFHMPADPNFDFETFYEKLRLQGVVAAGAPTGGVAMHPVNAGYPGGSFRLSFVSGIDATGPYVDVIDNFNFFRVKRVYTRDPVVGALAVAPRVAGDAGTVTLRIYALTTRGILALPITAADLTP